MVNSKEVLDTALQLPEHERARIAVRLITSLEPEEETSEEVELAWQEVIGKRAGQVDREEVQCRPWEEVRDELKAKYHG